MAQVHCLKMGKWIVGVYNMRTNELHQYNANYASN